MIGVALALPSNKHEHERNYKPQDVIIRDVCIIGGGSTGTYSAIRLRDMGKSVAVVEIKDRLGGHTETYIDPVSHVPIDYGVEFFHNLSLVTDWFTRLGVSWTKAIIPPINTQNVDFRTGIIDASYVPASQAALGQALGVWTSLLLKYPTLNYGFILPDPVPDELLTPFRDTVKKYSLDALVYLIFEFRQESILDQPTLYVMKNFGLDLINNIINGFLTTADHDNSEIYQKALGILGTDALLSSKVENIDRPSSPSANYTISIAVSTPSGRKLIVAKKLLITIPPLPHILDFLDLTDAERDVFSQFNFVGYWTSIVRHDGIPDDIQINNIGADTPYNLPVLPGIISITQTGVPGLHGVKFGSPYAMSDDDVKNSIIDTFKRLKTGGADVNATAPDFVVFSSHTPFDLKVGADAIKAGFYEKMYALQGVRGTWWTGAAWNVHDSSLLWAFTEGVLPSLLA